MKKLLTLLMLLMLTSFGMSAARDWSYDASAYAKQAVVYAAVKTADGTALGSLDNCQIGAFIDGVCRGTADKNVDNDGNIIFTVRIGVSSADAGKAVQFAMILDYTEYTLGGTVTVSGDDETVGGIPSAPMTLTYTPIQTVSLPDRIDVVMGQTVNLRELITVTPTGATMPDELEWDYLNSQEFFEVNNDVLTPKKTNTDGAYLGLRAGSANASTNVYVGQPITKIELNVQMSSTLTVNINDDKTLNQYLKDILILTPSDATEEPIWKPSDTEGITESPDKPNYWIPAKVGTYTMTAMALNGSSATVNIIVRQPITGYNIKHQSITVFVGTTHLEELADECYTLEPENADTSNMYSAAEGEAFALQGSDGIVAVKAGKGYVKVGHDDLGGYAIVIEINVIEKPKTDDFVIAKDPLTIKMADYDLNKLGIADNLKANVSSEKYSNEIASMVWSENVAAGAAGILEIFNADDILAKAYGKTIVNATMNTLVAGFDDNGVFMAEMPVPTTISFGLEIVAAVSSIDQTYTSIKVLKGEDVTQYLPYTYTLKPESVAGGQDGISYSVSDNDANALRENDDNTITAVAVGTAKIYISHSDIPNSPVALEVTVVEKPEAAEFNIQNNPLVIEMRQDELSKRNINSELVANITSSKWGNYMNDLILPIEVPAQGANAILNIDNTDHIAQAEAFGTTHVDWRMTVTACAFIDGKFIADNEYLFSIGYDVTITQGLNSISVASMTIGSTETGTTLQIVTDPAGFVLDADYIKFDIPYNTSQQPLLVITKAEGTNTWTVAPNAIGQGELAVYYNQLTAIADVKVTQKLELASGWSWISLFGSTVPDIAKYMPEAQEVRSQTELAYNDPKLGFFGSLTTLDNNTCYKICIKEGSSLNYVAQDIDKYENTVKKYTFGAQWSWMNNPYAFDHNFTEVAEMGKFAFPVDSRIISKDGGFAVYNGKTCEGTLTTLKAGEGYLVYNAGTTDVDAVMVSEVELSKVSRQGMPRRVRSYMTEPVWEYDSKDFADNMTVIARVGETLEEGRYAVGAFVNGECRGEGEMVGQRFYITVHGNHSDKVSFKMFDTVTGKYTDVITTIPFAEIAGSYSVPVTLTTAQPLGVDDVFGDNGSIDIRFDGDAIVVNGVVAEAVSVYNVAGQQMPMEGLASGTYIVKVLTADGVITKKLIKK